MNSTLSQWLCLLWGVFPPLRLDSDSPFIAGGVVHLPARSQWRQHAAAAAHATAHLVYSPARFDGGGLGPIARSLLALLEDARVEVLAMRELPGLARMWRPLHTATPALGEGFEALMERLARSLADPDYDDPSPWVRKGRALFYLDAGLGLSALRTPAELREAATRLGHDIGQMRLQFNAGSYRPTPAYRDDHRWMWVADAVEHAAAPGAACSGSARDDDDPVAGEAAPATLHPEWDRLISRLRPDWCRVVEQPAPAAPPEPVDAATLQVGHRLPAVLRALTRRVVTVRRDDQGDVFDLDALVAWRIARRLRCPPDARVYRGRRTTSARAAVWLLIDQSASTVAAQGPGGRSVLQAALQSAGATALALQAAGVAFAIAGFRSNGRNDVRLQTVKGIGVPADAAMVARLQALRPGGSTRLGAALRHATHRLAPYRGGPRWVLLLSDGHPHDVDVHDPRYLVEDARRAVHGAARLGIRTACLVMGSDTGADARRIFGSRGVQAVHDRHDLPRALQRLLD